MKQLLLITLALFTLPCAAQDLSVHVIDMRTSHPYKNFSVNLRYDCNNGNGKGKWIRCNEKIIKTDATGTAIFHLVLPDPNLCVYLPDLIRSTIFESQELQGCPDEQQTGPNNPASGNVNWPGKISTLPAEVTFHIRPLTLREHFAKEWDLFWAD